MLDARSGGEREAPASPLARDLSATWYAHGRVTPSRLVVLAAILLGGAMAYDILRIPLQVNDSLDEILMASRSPGVWSSFTSTIGNTAYLRPLRFAESKLLYDLSAGHLFGAYKGFHIALLASTLMLFVRLLSVRTTADAAAAVFALAVLTGLHTFAGIIREAFPINHFLQVVVLCLLAANLSHAKPRWWVDVAAVAAFAAACLTLESGVLVFVVLLACRLAGLRGVSDRGLVGVGLLLVAYLWFRFVYLDLSAREMTNASGYWLVRLEPEEIRRRFGDGLSRFSAYNVAAAGLSVLFSEPRAGRFVFASEWLAGEPKPWAWIAVITSGLTTLLIAFICTWCWRRGGDLRRQILPEMILFVVVMTASAALCFAYVKDEVVSVAGVFYALLVFRALRVVLSSPIPSRVTGVIMAVAVLAAGSGWLVRSMGVHYIMAKQAFNVHNDWGEIPESLQEHGKWPEDRGSQELVLRLQRESLGMSVPNPRFQPVWFARLFEDVD